MEQWNKKTPTRKIIFALTDIIASLWIKIRPIVFTKIKQWDYLNQMTSGTHIKAFIKVLRWDGFIPFEG